MNLSARAYLANIATGAVTGLIAGAMVKTENYGAWAAAGAGAGLAMTLTADLIDTAGDENKAKLIAAYDRAAGKSDADAKALADDATVKFPEQQKPA